MINAACVVLAWLSIGLVFATGQPWPLLGVLPMFFRIDWPKHRDTQEAHE